MKRIPLLFFCLSSLLLIVVSRPALAETVVIHVKTPQKKYGEPEGPEKRLLTREGAPAAQNQQYDMRKREFKLAVDDVYWGDVQVQGVAATGERGIVKSTHDLMGVKSFSYRPEHYGPETIIEPRGSAGPQDDNAINNYGTTYAHPSETLKLIFPGPVHDPEVIVVLLGPGESLVWRVRDAAGKELATGTCTAADGKMIPSIDSQNNFGKDKTCQIPLPAGVPFHSLELEAGPDSAYSLAGIIFQRD